MNKEKIWNPYTFSLGFLLLVILVLYLIAFQVPVGEMVVVTTFGKPSRVIREPGLYWKAPWPIQEVYRFDGRIHVLESKMEETYTRDGKNVILITSTFWKIKDPLTFFTSVGDRETAERKLVSLVRNYEQGVIGTYELSNLINVEEDLLKLDEIQEKIKNFSNRESKQTYGVEILEVLLKRIQFPREVTQDVFERMKKERERIAQKFLAEGEGMASDIKAKADAEKERILAEARASAKRIRGEGDAEAARYYDIFSENEELAIFLRKLESLESTLKNNATVILDSRTPPYDLLMGSYLEKDEINKDKNDR
ncbi:MAG TPA: protease modulator HflC [Candidatus Omnitrophica bacterium]|nr:protease modulator HflC [Candidatus Omnitrophota bacterium]